MIYGGHVEVFGLTFNPLAGANLVLPLSGHHLGICTGNLDSGIHASLVVSLDDVTAVDLSCSHTTVVWTLRTRETVLRPAIWPPVDTEESVFLLEAEPELMLGVRFHQPFSLVSVIELVRAPIRIPGLAHDQDVWL